ncbi:hypothetical protein SLS58_001646 [Diplodia intermedia]|uniref:Ankyrin repeat protein n=1 Tax=Diplodia intermedia TaxID=856260 RepID=A0ABR3U2A6_9PEZI
MEHNLRKFEASLTKTGMRSFTMRLRKSFKKVDYGIIVSKEVRKLRARISEQLQELQLNMNLDALTMISGLDSNISGLSTGISGFSTDISGLSTDISGLSTGISSLSTNILNGVEDQLKTQSAQTTLVQQQNLRREVLAWLRPVMSFQTKYNDSIGEILPGSCDWILARQEYNDWLRATSSGDKTLLWVTGIPGAGKTTIATRVIETLRQHHQVAYFYCEARTESSLRASNIMSTLAWQLLKENPQCLDEVSGIYDTGAEPHLASMQATLETLLRQIPKALVVVDGIDECQRKERADLCKSLMCLYPLGNVILFSRDLEDIKDGLTTVDQARRRPSRLDIREEDTHSDIESFISHELAKLSEIDDEGRTQLAQALQSRAQGMFLWVDLMIKHLKNGWVDSDDYLEVIERMPQDLDELYARILQSVCSESATMEMDRLRSKVILQWLVCAQRPLTLLEISVASKVTTEEPRIRRPILFGPKQLKRHIRRLTGPIVRISDTTSIARVSLVHATAKDFLLRSNSSDRPFAELLVNARTANTFIARTCLIYLCYENIEFPPFSVHVQPDGHIGDTWESLDSKFEKYCEQYPLLQYAALHWSDHFETSDGNKELCQILSRFCTSESNTIRWLQIYLRKRGDRGSFRSSSGLNDLRRFESCRALLIGNPSWYESWLRRLKGPSHGRFERWQRFMASGNANDFLPPLHVAAFFDFHHFLDRLLQDGANANERSIELQTPLHLAARGDSVESGKILIRRGADINATGWASNTPLSWAIDVECNTSWSKSGPFDMVDVLLDAGADATLTQDRLPPLHRACDTNIPDDPFLLNVVRSILLHGADKFIDGHQDSDPPLANAAASGAQALVKLLLDFGANPDGGTTANGLRRPSRYPLLAAAKRTANVDVISLLLDAGADANCRGPDRRNALHYCVKNCRKPLGAVGLLLSAGTDVNAQATDGSLPLHDAVAENNLDMAKALIKHGSSLDVEDVIGLTPLTLAIEIGCFEAADFLIEAGASVNGRTWQLLPTGNGHFEVSHHDRDTYWPQTLRDCFEVYWIIRSKLSTTSRDAFPRSAVVNILDTAGYWLRSTYSRADLEEYDQERAALGIPYILSDPLEGRARHPVREVTIVTRSHDQGWSDYQEHHGTYSQSYTWFEIAIQKPGGRWVEVEESEKKFVYNVHASDRTRQHCVVFRGRGWIDLLEPGDRIGVVPQAVYLVWVNFVESVSIHVMTSFIA